MPIYIFKFLKAINQLIADNKKLSELSFRILAHESEMTKLSSEETNITQKLVNKN